MSAEINKIKNQKRINKFFVTANEIARLLVIFQDKKNERENKH